MGKVEVLGDYSITIGKSIGLKYACIVLEPRKVPDHPNFTGFSGIYDKNI